MEGQELGDGRFKLQEILDERGLAVVYRAWDMQEENECAVKKLLSHHSKSAVLRDALLEQATLLGKLAHKHVVRVRAVGSGTDPWYAMDLLDAGNVGTWVAVHGRMPPKMVIDIAMQVCKGLAVAHKLGIAHGRLTASAILVDQRGICKLTAFGSAGSAALRERALDQKDLAPEQRDAYPPTARSDVWQLGAVLVYLLTARSLSEFPGGVASAPIEPSLMRVLKDALAEDRAARFADTYEFARALAGVKTEVVETPKDTPGLAMDRQFTPASSSRVAPWDRVAPAATTVPTERLVLPKIELETASATLASPVRLTAAAAVLVLIVVSIVLGVGAVNVRNAEATAHAADDAYFNAVMDTASLRTELVALGADQRKMDKASAFFDRTPIDLGAVEPWLVYTHREIDIVARFARPEQKERLTTAKRKLGALHTADEGKAQANAQFAAASSGAAGRLAISIGLASGPDR